jgi:chaperonin GroES
MATTAKKKPAKKKKKTSLQPLGERIVVERVLTQDKTSGGIFLPESAKDKQSRGTVVAVGEGRLLNDGSRSPLQVKPGDDVLFTSYGPEEFKDGDNEFLLMREDDVLAILG